MKRITLIYSSLLLCCVFPLLGQTTQKEKIHNSTHSRGSISLHTLKEKGAEVNLEIQGEDITLKGLVLIKEEELFGEKIYTYKVLDDNIEISGAVSNLVLNYFSVDNIAFANLPSLKELQLKANPLQSLELQELVNLQILDLSDSPLGRLDLSHNRKLAYLDCSNCNLSSIDFSNNLKLDVVSVSHNKLSLLDVSMLKDLGYLSASSNQLSSLDVTKNANLYELYADENQLSAIDLSQNKVLELLHLAKNQFKEFKLESHALKEIYINDNDISMLELNIPSLELLCCYSNQLKSIDLSKIQNINTLSVHTNLLQSINLKMLQKLEYLWINNNQLTDLDVSNSPLLLTIECYANMLSEKATQAFVKTLPVAAPAMDATLIIINTSSNDQNVCNNSSVKEASLKNWHVYDFCGGKEGYPGLPYEGSKDTQTTIPSVVFTSSDKEGEWNFRIAVSEETKSTTWLDLNANELYDPGEELTDNILKNGWRVPRTTDKITLYGAVSELYCSENKLIEIKFTTNPSLEILDCSSNHLTSLDLKNLPNLSILLCSENKLTQLDTSKSPSLSKLWCSKNAGIKSLNLSTNRQLMALWCYDCSLTSLDLSSCTSLSGIDCHNNQLTSLTLGKIDYLTRISCFNNQLETLDLTGVANLDELNCSGNKLTKLSIASVPYLTHLNCAKNSLSSLEVSTVPHLVSLYCQQNELTSLDLSRNKALEVLFCYENKIEEKAIGDLILSLRTIPNEHYQNLMIVNTSSNKEKNFPTEAHVATARTKGWIPKDFQNGINKGEGVPFAGFSATESIASDGNFLVYSPKEGTLVIEGESMRDLRIYTIEGTLLYYEKPSEKRKHVVTLPFYSRSLVVALGDSYQKIVLH